MGSWGRLVFLRRVETKLEGNTKMWDSPRFFSLMEAVSP